jgi:uracil-DNA glycosylase
MHLRGEIQGLAPSVILALGAVSHRAVLKALDIRVGRFPFGHGRLHDLPRLTLVDSYHPSRYNVNTGRLTPEMFHAVVGVAKGALAR